MKTKKGWESGHPPIKLKFNGKWYVYDRYTRSGKAGANKLRNIGKDGVNTGRIKGYRVVQSPYSKKLYFLFVLYY